MLQKHEVYILIIVSTAVFVLVGLFLLLFVTYFIKQKKKVLLEKEALQKEFKEALVQAQLEIQEQTLHHIGQELHDNFGQIASLIKINLNTLEFDNTEKTTQKIEATKELVRQLIADIRALSVSLNSDLIAQKGLVEVLKNETERLNKTGQFKAIFLEEGTHPFFDNDKATILYRMAQETINNMVKHSKAAKIMILITSTEDTFSLGIKDDGIGFNLEEKIKSGGAGLRNLQNRARLINALLDIESAPGKGTFIKIELPITVPGS